jgi:hypothetical protein
MTNLNYTVPTVDPQWANSRETNMAVATAIHAIADDKRSPEAIWEDPTTAEFDHITMAVEQYVTAGIFPAKDNGRYPWGCGVVIGPSA